RFDDRAFDAARAEADAAYADGTTDAALEERFLRQHPDLPTAELAARDFSTFRTSQRERVTRLLRSRRLRVATAAGPRLLLHAGVTRDELDRLGLTPEEQSDSASVAAALNDALDLAV